MFKINTMDNTIEMINGDTGVLKINFSNYELKEGDRVYLSASNPQMARTKMLRGDDGGYAFQKMVTVELEGNSISIVIGPEDTQSLEGEFLYDVQLSCANGYVDTIIPPSKLIIKRGVTNE